MDRDFAIWSQTRTNILELTEELSVEQWNASPEHFTNNLIWNAGHVLVTAQLLFYNLTGQSEKMDTALVEKYRKGTAPDLKADEEEIKLIRGKLEHQIPTIEADYNGQLFKEFTPYQTSFGYELNSAEDAVAFCKVHEGLHLGYMMALKKLV